MTGHDHREELNLGLPPAAGMVANPAGAGPRDGLSWSWELDVEALLDAVSDPAPWNRAPAKPRTQPVTDAHQAGSDSAEIPVPPSAPEPEVDPADADLAEYLDAVEAGRSQVVPLPVVAGRVAELVPAGPGLAGWLGGETSGLEDGALAGTRSEERRVGKECS